MKAYCEGCGVIESFSVQTNPTENMEVDGYKFSCLQKHAFCNKCSNEVFPNDLDDFNIDEAHHAYCRAAGITPKGRAARWSDLRERIYIYWQTHDDFSIRDLDEYALSQTEDKILVDAVVTDFIQEFISPL